MRLFQYVALMTVLVADPKLPRLDLGGKAPSTAEKTDRLLFVAPAQMWPERLWKFDGVEYSLGVDDTGLIQYIATKATGVSTEEGVFVGQTYAELVRKRGVRVGLWPGWGFVAELPSGWKAALFLDGEFLKRSPESSDHVDLLFKGTPVGYGVGRPKR